MVKDIMKLLVLLAAIGAIILGIHYLGMQEDNKSKYQHPITQPGARW